MQKVYKGDLSFEGGSFEELNFKVSFTDVDLQRIRLLQSKLQDLPKAYCFSGITPYEITYFDEPIDVWEGSLSEMEEGIISKIKARLDVVVVHVGEVFIRITGSIKHDSYTWSTGIFQLEDMEDE